MLMPIYGFKVDGILGFDFFSRFITKIDYANEKLSVYNPENFKYKGDGAIIPVEIDNNIPKAPVKVNEIHTGSWSIDTGATLTSFHYPYAKENNFHDEKGLYSLASGVGGDYMKNYKLGAILLIILLLIFQINQVKELLRLSQN